MTVAYTKPVDTQTDLTVASAFDPMDSVKNGLNDHFHGLTTNGAERHTGDQIDDTSILETTALSNSVSNVHARLDMLFLEVRQIISPTAANLTAAEAARVAASAAGINVINLWNMGLTHGHSGSGQDGAKLLQANTHQSPDTDVSTTSLHHTLGIGANQAAAGNHSHDARYYQIALANTAGQTVGLDGSALIPIATIPTTIARDAAVVHNTLLGTASGVATLDGSILVPLAQIPVTIARDSAVVHNTLLGAAGGVATLDGSALIPIGQVPASIARTSALASYVLLSSVAAAGGVASLDGSALVPVAQIPSSIARTAATATLAHTHTGVGESQVPTAGIADFAVVGGINAGSKLATQTVVLGNLADGAATASGLVITFKPFQFRDINNNFIRKNSALTYTYTSGMMPVANPRIDLIQCDMTGVLTRKAGTEAPTPVEPVADVNTFGVEYVYLRVATTTIFNADTGGANTGYIYEGRPSPGFVPAGGISATTAMPVSAPVLTILPYGTATNSGDFIGFMSKSIATTPINGFTPNNAAYTGNTGPAAVKTGATDANLEQMLIGHFSVSALQNPLSMVGINATSVVLYQYFGANISGRWYSNWNGNETITLTGAAGLRYVYADPTASKGVAGNMLGLVVCSATFAAPGTLSPAAPVNGRLLTVVHWDGSAADTTGSADFQNFSLVQPTQHRLGGLYQYPSAGGTNVVNSATQQFPNTMTPMVLKRTKYMTYVLFGAIRLVNCTTRGLFVGNIAVNPTGYTGTLGPSYAAQSSTKTMDPVYEPDVTLSVGPALFSPGPGTDYIIPTVYTANTGVATAYWAWLFAIPSAA